MYLYQQIRVIYDSYDMVTDYLVELRLDRKSTRLNSSHFQGTRMPSSA